MGKLVQSFGKEALLYVANKNMNITPFMKLTFLIWYEGQTRHYKFFKNENAICEVLDALKRAYYAKIEAVAVTYVGCDKQLEVIGFTEVGRLERLSRLQWITKQVQRARNIVTGNIQVISTPEKAVKPDPIRMAIRVRYKENDEARYLFRCNEAHIIGDFVAVDYCDGAILRKKNVQVAWAGTMKESEFATEAKRLGYKDIAPVASETAIDDPVAWHEWGGHDPRKPAPVLTGLLSDKEMEEAKALLESMKRFEAAEEAFEASWDDGYESTL